MTENRTAQRVELILIQGCAKPLALAAEPSAAPELVPGLEREGEGDGPAETRHHQQLLDVAADPPLATAADVHQAGRGDDVEDAADQHRADGDRDEPAVRAVLLEAEDREAHVHKDEGLRAEGQHLMPQGGLTSRALSPSPAHI